MNPREVHESISFVLTITQSNAWVLCYKAVLRNWRILNIVWVGVIGNLIVIVPQRGDESKLVGRIYVENQRAEATVPVGSVVNHLRNGCLQAEITSVPVHTGVIGETLGVFFFALLRTRLAALFPYTTLFRFGVDAISNHAIDNP